MPFNYQQNSWDLKSAGETGLKKAKEFGYGENHAITNFLQFAIIMTDFEMTPQETFDRWINMVNTSNNATPGEMILIPNALPKAETTES